jgi:hypothetical protein
MDDRELQNIYHNYKSVTSSPSPNKSKDKDWLNFLSHKDIATLPVQWSAVETPSGTSWGSNVTFANIMNRAKGIHKGSNNFEMVAPRMSSELQDFVIGLHEDKKVIDQNQASELITMFQNMDSLKYFLENYEKIKEITETPEKTDEDKKSNDPPTYLILKGNFDYNEEDVKGGLKRLRSLYDEAVIKTVASTSVMLSNQRDLHREPETNSKLADAMENPTIKSILNFESDRYKQELQRLNNIYNSETQNGTKPMSEEGRKNINDIFNLYILDLSQKTAAKIIMEKIGEQGRFVTFSDEGEPTPSTHRPSEKINSKPKKTKKEEQDIHPQIGM